MLAQTAEELVRSANQKMSQGTLMAQAVFVLVAGMCFYAAFTTLKSGFKVSESKRLSGGANQAVAVLMVLLGVGFLALVFWLPSYLS